MIQHPSPARRLLQRFPFRPRVRLARARAVRSACLLLLLALCGLALWGPAPRAALAQETGEPLGAMPVAEPAANAEGMVVPPVVINELHVKPDLDTERLEFVEIYNYGTQPLNLSFWTLGDGVRFTFPQNTVLAPATYLLIAQDPDALRARYGVTALGPYEGRLALEGERLTLRDSSAALVDEVTYGSGFPWPTVGTSPAASLQLMNPAFDGNEPGVWRSGAPTPGAHNRVLLGNAPPFVASVTHEPQQPRSGEPVVVTVTARDPNGIGAMQVAYQVVWPGHYIRLNDAAYATDWTTVEGARTGTDAEGREIWQATLPPALQQHRNLVRYRVTVRDGGTHRLTLPYADDLQPNFAYFVYDSLPHWPASLPGSPTISFNFRAMRQLPVYHFLALRSDVEDSMFLPDTALPSGYMGNDELWRGTLVYEGRVYDHVRFRARGGEFRYATGKTGWKIAFSQGHRFQMVDNFGRPYGQPRDDLNLNSGLQQTHRDRRGEHGMFEAMSYRLFNMAGVEGPHTDFVHWRVISEEREYTNQHRGDFWGLYLAIEQPDERMLEEHGLPDGNLYKIENFQGELNNLGVNGPADGSDLRNFQESYTYQAKDIAWWRAVFDLERYYSFRAVLEFTHHYDVNLGKNYLYYRNPDTGRWSVHPWDVDLTWYEDMPGTGVEPLLGPVLSIPEFQVEYQNRLRELRDLLFNAEQIGLMLDEQAALIDLPTVGNSMVDADRFLWDYNPVFGTRYVVPTRTEAGKFYTSTAARTFRAMIQQMKEFAAERMAWIDATLLTDVGYPVTPGISYSGAAGFPADGLRFTAGAYGGPAPFSMMEWRIAEVTHPGAPVYDPSAPFLYEIDARWESGEIGFYQPEMTPPGGVIEPGHAYRVRVRMRDVNGRWSHWSAPMTFVAAPPSRPVTQELTLTEIMYHPPSWTNVPDEDLEFIELMNRGQAPLDLAGFRVSGGIDYAFPPDATLAPGALLVLAREPAAFERRYRLRAFGEFDGRLNNSGDTVTLLDPWGRTLFSVEYDDKEPWPEEADGDGYSLTSSPLAQNLGSAASWGLSQSVGGSPGALEPTEVWINEVRLFPAEARAVELYNPGAQPADVSHWYLSNEPGDPRKVRLPAGSLVPPGGYLVLDAARLATASFDGPLVINAVGSNRLYLTMGRFDGSIGGYQSAVQLDAAEPGVSYGRMLDSMGRVQMVAQLQPTLGAANSGPRVGPLVISALHYQPAPAGPATIEYVELANTGTQPVKLYLESNPALTWLVEGASFSIPAGVELAAGERLLLVAAEPDAACAVYGGRGMGRIHGPFGTPLPNSQGTVRLLRPLETGQGVTFVVADAVTYSAAAPWPVQAAGEGAALQRAPLDAYGNDPANWQIRADLPGAGSPPADSVSLCSFTARYDAQAKQMLLRWALDAPLPADVTGFRLYRSSTMVRAGAEPVPMPPAAGSPDAGLFVYTVTDAGAPEDPSAPVYYWLEAERAGGAPLPVAITTPLRPWRQIYLPHLSH